MEADCVVELAAGDAEGTLELSRTRALGTTLTVECERGELTVPLGVADDSPDGGVPAAFAAQLRDFLRAARGEGEPAVGAREAIATAELVDACYAQRRPLPEPWLRQAVAPR
jgi:predicted dehydrogenase